MKATVLDESSLYFFFSPGYLHYCDVYRRESGRCYTLPFFLTFFITIISDKCICDHPSKLSHFTSNITSAFVSCDYPLPLLQHQLLHPPSRNPLLSLPSPKSPSTNLVSLLRNVSSKRATCSPSTRNLLPHLRSITFCHHPRLPQSILARDPAANPATCCHQPQCSIRTLPT